MKKIGLGTRPSEVKRIEKQLEIGTEDTTVEPVGAFHRSAPPTARRAGKSSGGLWKAAMLSLALLAIGIGIGLMFSGSFSTRAALDQVLLITGQREVSLTDGEKLSVPYLDGLQCKRVNLKGFYRLLPPSNLTFEIIGIPETRGRYNQNLVELMKPEERTSYELLVSRGQQALGRISLNLEMTAQAWIARADSVGDRDIQAACFKKAVEVDPEAEDAHVALGRLYEAENKLKSATDSYEAAVKINPQNVRALNSLVILYQKRKQDGRLISTYERLGKADVEQADSHFYAAGMLSEKAGQTNKAVYFYRKALAKNRAHLDARRRLIKLYEKDKNWKRAVGNTKVLLEYDPKNPELYLYLSQMYLRAGKPRAAVSAAEKAEKYQPGDASIFLQLAGLCEKAKMEPKAIEYYRKVIKLDQKNAVAYNNLGLLLERKGSRTEAIQNYQSAVRLEPARAVYRMNLADAYEKNKQWNEAAGAYEQVVKHDKDNRSAWEALAELQYKTKKHWKALEAYRQLTRLEPKKVLWHQKMALLYEELGRLKQARGKYRDILAIDSGNQEAKRKYREISVQLIKGKNG